MSARNDDSPAEDSSAIPADENDALLGRTLENRYRILRRIGEGGMSVVYEAHHELIHRRVAVKVLRAEYAATPSLVSRFMAEGRAAGTLDHPNVAESTDMGHTPGGAPFLVYELLDGRLLADELDRRGPFPAWRALRIAEQIARGLEAAHERGIVHRDMKPENVFLTVRDGRTDFVKIFDFGISKFGNDTHIAHTTHVGTMMGTPAFMSPEQIDRMSEVDGRADVYALGAVLYSLLTCEAPFKGTAYSKMFHDIVNIGPRPIGELRPDLDRGIVALVEKAMARDRDQRFASAADMAAALGDLIEITPVNIEEAAVLEAVAAREASSTGAPRRQGTFTPSGRSGSRRRLDSISDTILAESGSQGDSQRQLDDAPDTTRIHALGAQTPHDWRKRAALVVGVLALLGLMAGTAFYMGRRNAPQPAEVMLTSTTATGTPPSPPAAPEIAISAPVTLSLSSNIAAAHAIVRGQEMPLPAELKLSPSSEPEMVVVLAKGYQGKRYNLTIDRPQQVSAELKPGWGLVDAAPAVSVESDTHSSGRGASAPLLLPRPSSGRVAGSVTPAALSPSPLSTSTPTPTPTPTTTPTPTHPPAQTTVTPPAPPGAAQAGPEPGFIDPKGLNAVVRANAGQVQACSDRARMEQPDLGGRVVVTVTLNERGTVSSARIAQSSAGSPRLESCLLSALRGWAFPPPAGNTHGVFNYTFRFD